MSALQNFAMVKGHKVLVFGTPAEGYSVSILKPGSESVMVVGMYGVGGLDLSEYSPDGKKVEVSQNLYERFSDAVEGIVSEYEFALDTRDEADED